jgi:hypothetical protein
MVIRWLHAGRAAVTVFAAAICSCGGDVTQPVPVPGAVLITANTTGLDAPSAYSIRVDNTVPRTISPLGSVEVNRLPPGDHEVRIEVPANCTVDGGTTRVVSVASKATTTISFNVVCVSTSGILTFNVATGGPDVPPFYVLKAEPGIPIQVLHTMFGSIPDLEPGPHTITLEGVPPHCSVADNPRVVNITAGTLFRDTVHTDFQIGCTAITGVLKVSVTTGGEDADLGGYSVRVDAGPPRVVQINGAVQFNWVAGGERSVALGDIASNCTVSGANPRTVQIQIGGTAHDTAHVAFDVACAHVERIAFTRYDAMSAPKITVVNADGSDEFGINIEGILGSWSPDGKKLLMIGVDCDDWYGYYYGCSYLGVRTVAIDKLPAFSVMPLTNSWEDAAPAFSADGQKVAFIRKDALYVMNADGSGQTAIAVPGEASNLKSARSPSWSPDGTRIAFGCGIWQIAWSDICVVNANGSDLTRVTADPYHDDDPVWSPDGTRLAFTTNRGTTDGAMHVATISPTGTDFVQLGLGSRSAWSPDGGRILYVVVGVNRGIYSMKSDGSDVRRITSGNDHDPKWRP